MLVIIDNYDSFTYNLVHFFGELGAMSRVYRNDAISIQEVFALQPHGIVLSPGPRTPEHAGICLEIVKQAAGVIPILGVCLGHQSIGQAFGGKIVQAPTIMHGKLSSIYNNGEGIFRELPPSFQATRYHSLVIEASTMPSCFQITAQTDDGVVMGISHQKYNIYGVQFHPESIASESGHALLQNFLKIIGLS